MVLDLGELVLDSRELAEAIVWFKKHGYAFGAKKERIGGNCKRVRLEKGNFLYEDEWCGDFQAPGREIVIHKPTERRVWQMAYWGGMLPEFEDPEFIGETFAFLKTALAKVSVKRPFRGPEYSEQGEFAYLCEVKGDISNFNGEEKIYHRRELVFKQCFGGSTAIEE